MQPPEEIKSYVDELISQQKSLVAERERIIAERALLVEEHEQMMREFIDVMARINKYKKPPALPTSSDSTVLSSSHLSSF
jgi:hypothetical protein